MPAITDSSMFTEYSYDASSWVLTLRFASTGKMRRYADVPPDVADEFGSAKSKGSFYNSKIKGAFTGEEVIEEAAAPVTKRMIDPEDEMGITTADIQRVDPTYVPTTVAEAVYVGPDVVLEGEVKVVAPVIEPEVLSPEQAVAVIAPKSPKTDELTSRAHALAAKIIHVSDKASQAEMEAHLVQLQTVRRALFELVDPHRAIAYAAYEAIQKLNKSKLDPLDNALASGRRSISIFLTAERERAAAEQRRLDAEARARADEEQRQRTEALRLQVAEEKQAAGDSAGAEASLFDQEIQAPPAHYVAPRVEEPKSTLGGRANWKAEVMDMEAVILDVAEGIKSARECGSLKGHAPASILMVAASPLKKLAEANKEMFRFPGLRAWDNRVVVVKTGKE